MSRGNEAPSRIRVRRKRLSVSETSLTRCSQSRATSSRLFSAFHSTFTRGRSLSFSFYCILSGRSDLILWLLVARRFDSGNLLRPISPQNHLLLRVRLHPPSSVRAIQCKVKNAAICIFAKFQLDTADARFCALSRVRVAKRDPLLLHTKLALFDRMHFCDTKSCCSFLVMFFFFSKLTFVKTTDMKFPN